MESELYLYIVVLIGAGCFLLGLHLSHYLVEGKCRRKIREMNLQYLLED